MKPRSLALLGIRALAGRLAARMMASFFYTGGNVRWMVHGEGRFWLTASNSHGDEPVIDGAFVDDARSTTEADGMRRSG